MFRFVFQVMLLLALSARSALAGGTLASEELDSLLKQQPDVREFVISTLKLSESAYAEVRLGSHFEKLGGTKLGPYTIQAQSLKDGRALEVVLCTKARFLGRNGRELAEHHMEKAAKVEEKLIAIMLRQPKNERPVCP